MNKVIVTCMVWGALVWWLPIIADPYITPRLLPLALCASIALTLRGNGRSTLEKPALIMLSAVALTAFFAKDKAYAVIGSYQVGMDSLISVTCYVTLLMAAARSGMTSVQVAECVSVASIPVSLYGILQRFFHDPLLWQELHGGTRVASTQGGPIFLGAVMAVCVLCCLRSSLDGSRLGRVALTMSVACLWFTQTRGAVLAAGIGAAFMVRGAWMAAIPALLLMPRLYQSVVSDIARLEIWKIAWRVFVDNPLTGYGPGNFYLAFRRYADWDMVKAVGTATYVQAHAHNDVLHVAATMGLTGLAAYAWLAWSSAKAAYRHEDRRFLLGLLAAYAVVSAFNPVTTAAFAVLAVILGAATSESTTHSERRALPALAAIVVTLLVGRLTLADWHYAKAYSAKDKASQAYEFQEATRLNPWEMFYTCRRIDSLMGAIPYMELTQRRSAALVGRDLAVDAVKLHPFDSYAHELYGKQILIGHIAGFRDIDPNKALEAFDKAQDFAPTFEKLMWRRRNTAEELGDMAEVWLADKDINDLREAVAFRKKRS